MPHSAPSGPRTGMDRPWSEDRGRPQVRPHGRPQVRPHWKPQVRPHWKPHGMPQVRPQVRPRKALRAVPRHRAPARRLVPPVDQGWPAPLAKLRPGPGCRRRSRRSAKACRPRGGWPASPCARRPAPRPPEGAAAARAAQAECRRRGRHARSDPSLPGEAPRPAGARRVVGHGRPDRVLERVPARRCRTARRPFGRGGERRERMQRRAWVWPAAPVGARGRRRNPAFRSRTAAGARGVPAAGRRWPAAVHRHLGGTPPRQHPRPGRTARAAARAPAVSGRWREAAVR